MTSFNVSQTGVEILDSGMFLEEASELRVRDTGRKRENVREKQCVCVRFIATFAQTPFNNTRELAAGCVLLRSGKTSEGSVVRERERERERETVCLQIILFVRVCVCLCVHARESRNF